eukprot:CAMPEP_0197298912 /NCGR_PEP_ID=MMETSP0890-20130614/44772_1 /TAXON_ID=44058 ORGANISM="Aureoumbra lagunensis, Strain CCMP1510" /NCGR_SAMPLE_ID=MMETSP0890 /ASSEMBLY_ACC=CAM_ASM_000533 /LENGTH=301 /DNA_ID=CAMNT_0042776951 /DNA_START=677 /DNA_END=1582 /DNA_ORIENTATION=-
MTCDKKRPEAWIAAAAFAASQNQNDRAVQLLDKAISLDPRRVTAFQLRGATLLKLNKPELAVVAFFQANNISKELRTYRGLVDAYLSARKYKEALHSAKEAVSLLAPNAALPIALVGKVLATSPEGSEKAKRAFQKALQVDPACVDALLPLVDILGENSNDSFHLLQTALAAPCTQKDLIHFKLGQFYAKSNRISDALHSFHLALSLNPNNQQAQGAIDSLHSLLPSSPTTVSSTRRREHNTRRAGHRSSPTRSHRATTTTTTADSTTRAPTRRASTRASTTTAGIDTPEAASPTDQGAYI